MLLYFDVYSHSQLFKLKILPAADEHAVTMMRGRSHYTANVVFRIFVIR